MWIFLSDALFSIVKKDCERDELLVRARRQGDIEKVFPGSRAYVQCTPGADYLYRAAIKTATIQEAMTREVSRINYSNFKSSVDDQRLHDAYMDVWMAVVKLQPAGRSWFSGYDFETTTSPPVSLGTMSKRKRKRKGRRS